MLTEVIVLSHVNVATDAVFHRENWKTLYYVVDIHLPHCGFGTKLVNPYFFPKKLKKWLYANLIRVSFRLYRIVPGESNWILGEGDTGTTKGLYVVNVSFTVSAEISLLVNLQFYIFFSWSTFETYVLSKCSSRITFDNRRFTLT